MPATVTGRFTDPKLQPRPFLSFQVVLESLEDPDGKTTQSDTIHTTDGSGNFSIPELYRGVWEIVIGNFERVKFRVPDSIGTYIISNILEN